MGPLPYGYVAYPWIILAYGRFSLHSPMLNAIVNSGNSRKFLSYDYQTNQWSDDPADLPDAELDPAGPDGAQGRCSAVAPVPRPTTNPNPVTTRTSIRFTSSRPGPHSVAVYSPFGKCVRTLLNRELGPGNHSLEWDRRNDSGQPAPAGVYLLRIEGPDFQTSCKLVVR